VINIDLAAVLDVKSRTPNATTADITIDGDAGDTVHLIGNWTSQGFDVASHALYSCDAAPDVSVAIAPNVQVV